MTLPAKIVAGIVTLFVIVALTQVDFSENQNKKKNNSGEEPKTIEYVASHTNDLSNFTVALKTAHLADSLGEEGPFTVFAPNNNAFGELPDGMYQRIMDPAHKDELTNIFRHHIVRGAIDLDELEGEQTLTTIQGKQIKISTKDDTLTVDGAKIIKSDVFASNGVIHVVDSVMLPSDQ